METNHIAVSYQTNYVLFYRVKENPRWQILSVIHCCHFKFKVRSIAIFLVIKCVDRNLIREYNSLFYSKGRNICTQLWPIGSTAWFKKIVIAIHISNLEIW